MTEKFLHYLWRMKLLQNNALQTVDGEKIFILHAGLYNTDSGPDFLNAKIRIGATLWAGNIEIHLRASDWKMHKHQSDKAYDNVVLHVVYENDTCINREDGSTIPCLEIKNHFNAGIYAQYQSLMASTSWIPCASQLHKVPALLVEQWLQRLMVERLEEKTLPILGEFHENQRNWEETFYHFLAMAFGNRVNAAPFYLLARSLPVKVLAKHKNSLFQLEALLFGTAGFLHEKFSDSYPNELKKEFGFLQKKYGLQPLKKHPWKFLRLRPANFPTVRLAQFAQLIFKSSHLFSQILGITAAKDLVACFETEASAYWDDHYRFDKPSTHLKKKFGKSSIDSLFINTIVPFLFVYGKFRDENEYCDRAFMLLDSIKAEKNKVSANWDKLGISASSAFTSQALLQLHKSYCQHFRCLECTIGHRILNTGQEHSIQLQDMPPKSS